MDVYMYNNEYYQSIIGSQSSGSTFKPSVKP